MSKLVIILGGMFLIFFDPPQLRGFGRYSRYFYLDTSQLLVFYNTGGRPASESSSSSAPHVAPPCCMPAPQGRSRCGRAAFLPQMAPPCCPRAAPALAVPCRLPHTGLMCGLPRHCCLLTRTLTLTPITAPSQAAT